MENNLINPPIPSEKSEKLYENKCEKCQEIGRKCYAYFGQNDYCVNCNHLSIRHIDQQKTADKVKTEGDLKQFIIEPLESCPHLENCTMPEKLPELPGIDDVKCQSCKYDNQNWICVSCHYILCGRGGNGHMKQHAEITGHKIVASFNDLRFWCYECDNYISTKNKTIYPLYSLLHALKFGYEPIFENP